MVCPSCGLDNDPSAAFCARCNAALGPAFVQPVLEQPVYEQPAYEPPRPPRRSPVLPVLLAVGVILLIGVTVAGVVYVRSGPDNPGPVAGATATITTTETTLPTTDPTTVSPVSAHEQAAVIDSVLDRSVASRSKLNAAIDRVRRCTGLAGALADMRAVGAERNAQIATVSSADLSAFGEGESIRETLKTALGFALGADQHFVGWAEPTLTAGCGSSAARTAAWNSGQAVSHQAQAAKQQFLAVWNPVAGSLGFAERTTQYI